METIEKLEAELEAMQAKERALSEALEAAHEAYETVKAMHLQAIKDVSEATTKVIEAYKA